MAVRGHLARNSANKVTPQITNYLLRLGLSGHRINSFFYNLFGDFNYFMVFIANFGRFLNRKLTFPSRSPSIPLWIVDWLRRDLQKTRSLFLFSTIFMQMRDAAPKFKRNVLPPACLLHPAAFELRAGGVFVARPAAVLRSHSLAVLKYFPLFRHALVDTYIFSFPLLQFSLEGLKISTVQVPLHILLIM